MRRFAFRHLGLALSLILISIAVSGCFQTAGASLDATPVGNNPPPATQTLVPPTQAPETPPPVEVTVTTDAAVQPVTAVADQPTAESVQPTAEQPTQEQLPPPTEEPTPIPPTEAPLPTETLEPTPELLPTATLGVEVAQAATPTLRPNQPLASGPQGTQTAVQGTLFAQATEIIAGVTQTAAVDLTATATAQGTFSSDGQPQPAGATPTLGTGGAAVPTLAPGAPVTPATAAPQGTPGEAGSGAAGPISADCTYTVVEGDRLLRIALRFGTTPQVLARLNGIVNMDLVVPGQKIRVPNCFGTPVPGTTATLGGTPTFGTGGAATPVAGGGNRVHMVVDGDTLYGIATRYGSKVMAIAQANGIANINLIYIGQRLVIP
ncbi:MAG: LysM peptidoglycan-binding domain-containing protein [Anaerolineae bacterium]|nr:LysM peptidoglycan-binding domain-containing protein [Anaerolineae bacterium]